MVLPPASLKFCPGIKDIQCHVKCLTIIIYLFLAFGGGWVVLWTKPRASHMLGNHWAILPAYLCLCHRSPHSSAQPAKQCSCEHSSNQVQLPGVVCLILCYVRTSRIQPWDLVLFCTIFHCRATPVPPLPSPLLGNTLHCPLYHIAPVFPSS